MSISSELAGGDAGLDLYRTIDVSLMTPAIGAEVRGADLSRPLLPEQWTEIQQAFLRYQVLFFRDQEALCPEGQLRFGRLFGHLHIHPAAPSLEGYPEVMVVRADQTSKSNFGEAWHTDVSCEMEPPLCTILQMHELPPTGGDTLFASMYAAFDGLSNAMQQFLMGLTARHESEHYYRKRFGDPADSERLYPAAEHPVIRTHPDTGRQALFVNSMFTTRIQELNPEESAALLSFLLHHVESPYYQVRFKWKENDVAIWDNRCTQHRAIWDYWPHRRKGHRVTVRGTRPFLRIG
jgi:taurine dioxygenase